MEEKGGVPGGNEDVELENKIKEHTLLWRKKKKASLFYPQLSRVWLTAAWRHS